MKKGDLIICIHNCYGYKEGQKVGQAICIGEIFIVRDIVTKNVTKPSVVLEGIYNPINPGTGGEFCYPQRYFERYVNIALKEVATCNLQYN